MLMSRFVVVVLLASCAPSNDSTPNIVVEPGAASRICWFCVRAPGPIARRCPSDLIAERCGILLSDVMPVQVRFLTEDGGLVDLGDDAGGPEDACQ
jgi:hypothetical protein